jgi:hypothetical protein
MTAAKRPSSNHKNEHPADLTFWLGNGSCGGCRARVAASTNVSIGRTDSPAPTMA